MQRNSIIYLSESSNYASLAVSFSCIVNKIIWRYRSMFLKIGAVKNFANFTRKMPVLGSLFKLGSQACIFIKKRLQNKCFFLWNLLFFKISNSNNLFKDFSDILTHNEYSLIICNFRNDINIWECIHLPKTWVTDLCKDG